MKRIFLLIIILVILLTGLYFGVKNFNTSHSNSKPTATATITPTTPTVVINIGNSIFVPATQTIKVGTVVTWKNNDTIAHSIKSTVLSSPELKQNETYRFYFGQVGTFQYYCATHPTEKGEIIVEN